MISTIWIISINIRLVIHSYCESFIGLLAGGGVGVNVGELELGYGLIKVFYQ